MYYRPANPAPRRATIDAARLGHPSGMVRLLSDAMIDLRGLNGSVQEHQLVAAGFTRAEIAEYAPAAHAEAIRRVGRAL